MGLGFHCRLWVLLFLLCATFLIVSFPIFSVFFLCIYGPGYFVKYSSWLAFSLQQPAPIGFNHLLQSFSTYGSRKNFWWVTARYYWKMVGKDYLGKDGAWSALIWKYALNMKWNAVFFLEVRFLEFFRASLGKFGQKSFAPPKICLHLHLCVGNFGKVGVENFGKVRHFTSDSETFHVMLKKIECERRIWSTKRSQRTTHRHLRLSIK